MGTLRDEMFHCRFICWRIVNTIKYEKQKMRCDDPYDYDDDSS